MPEFPSQTRRRVVDAVVVLLLALCLPTRASLAGERLLVFAAASLGGPLARVATLFEQRTGTLVTLSHASTSTLARQIEHGAPAAVFISANPQWMDYLADADMLVAGTRFDWLGNRLVIVAPVGAVRTQKLADTLAAGRIAMGDPAHVPAGIYARESLRHLGLWDGVSTRIVPAANVRAALAMVARGEVAHGIVYATDARLEPGVAILHTLPEDSHSPIRYAAAALRPEQLGARAFLDFLRTPEVVEALQAAGFDVLANHGARWRDDNAPLPTPRGVQRSARRAGHGATRHVR